MGLTEGKRRASKNHKEFLVLYHHFQGDKKSSNSVFGGGKKLLESQQIHKEFLVFVPSFSWLSLSPEIWRILTSNPFPNFPQFLFSFLGGIPPITISAFSGPLILHIPLPNRTLIPRSQTICNLAYIHATWCSWFEPWVCNPRSRV